MSEGLAKRMRSIVGDENTVARYLLEKVGHTNALAWLAGCITLGIALPDVLRVKFFLGAATIAFVATWGYDLFGKVLWLYASWKRAHPPRSADAPRFLNESFQPVTFRDEIVDTLFDAWVGGEAVLVTSAILHWWYAPIALALWIVGIAIGSNNQWGKPS